MAEEPFDHCTDLGPIFFIRVQIQPQRLKNTDPDPTFTWYKLFFLALSMILSNTYIGIFHN